jgi:Cu/Ag efflux pump CusA
MILLFRGIRILRDSEKTFGGLMAVGLSFSLVFQALINMAVAVNLFPVTGQPLPLVSMGGTSIWFTCIAIGIILLVLVIQFNSIGKPIIILSEIVLSVIGVLLGTAIFKMDMSIVMTGIGIVALAGIVVRNGILLVEFAEEERVKGVSLYEATVDAGRTRMTPVVLTATAAILGLIPLAVGLNIDFEGLLAHGSPHIHFGGDNVVFWGPLSWTMIFGLAFATFLTLLLVPAMYLIAERLKRKAEIILVHFDLPKVIMYVPFFVAVCQLILWMQGKKLDYGNLDS